jgi:tetratricopeptide (TPR) repeat protein
LANDLVAAGLTHHRAGRFAEAEAAYRRALDSNPNFAEAQHLLGVVRMQQGDYPQAIDWMQRSIRQQPDVAQYYNNLAEALRLSQRLDEAAQACQTAVQLDPQYGDAWHNLGVVRLRQRRLDDAEDAARQAAILRPRSAATRGLVADVLREQGRIRAAIAAYQQAIALDETYAPAHGNLGLLLVLTGAHDEGLRHCRRAVELRPKSALARGNLGRLLLERGDIDAAMEELAVAVECDPNNAQWCWSVGDAWLELADYSQARGWYERAQALDAPDLEADCRLANLMLEMGDPESAVAAYQSVVHRDPQCVPALVGLARALLETGDVAGAVAAHEQAIDLRPEWAGLHAALGQTLTTAGELTRAVECQRRAIALNPHCVSAWSGLTTALGGQTTDDELKRCETMLSAPWMTNPRRCDLHFGLAAVWDGRGEPSRAAQHLVVANELQKKHNEDRDQGYHPDEHRRYIDRLIDAFTPEYFARTRSFGNPNTRPVFIVGMPRSGTTLTEQILASHPQVHGAGERRFINQSFHVLPQALGQTLPSVECLTLVTPAAVQELAEWHLQQLDQLDRGRALRIVDKMPDNYLLLGWIATLFPKARIVHCRRDVRDVALSCWMTQFARINWANDLTHLAQRVNEYQRIMAHYRRVLPTTMLEIDYEQLVSDQEGTSRRLIDFVGLDWHPACLEPHRTERLVKTASVTQVRQPIHRRSVAKWKRYHEFLQPFLKEVAAAQW